MLSHEQQPDVEPDSRFCSGPWIGFYRQGRTQSRQRMTLTFANGRIAGSGADPCGPFDLSGTYDTTTGASRWTKSYTTHRVFYDGSAAEGDGIPGTWSIQFAGATADTGAFKIWPDIVAMEDSRSLREQRPVTASETEWWKAAAQSLTSATGSGKLR